jgi:hypothetical protein
MSRMTALIRRPAHPLSATFVERRLLDEADPIEDLRLFATAWAGGLIFFGTLLS